MNAFLVLACVYVALAIACGLWARAIRRSWGDWIPCTGTQVDAGLVAKAIVGMVVPVLPIALLGKRMGPLAGPMPFVVFLLGASALGITWTIAMSAWGMHRRSGVWFRLDGSSTLRVKIQGEEQSLEFSPACVDYAWTTGIGGQILIHYAMSTDAGVVYLMVPHTRGVKLPLAANRFRDHPKGPFAQASFKELHAFFASYVRHQEADGAQ